MEISTDLLSESRKLLQMNAQSQKLIPTYHKDDHHTDTYTTHIHRTHLNEIAS